MQELRDRSMKSFRPFLALLLCLTNLSAQLVEHPMSNLYKKTLFERLLLVQQIANLNDQERDFLERSATTWANHMIENSIGTMPLPMGIVPYFIINDKEYLIPMVTEEPSVIAAASHGAKQARHSGGFTCSMSEQIMIGQMQCMGTIDSEIINATTTALREHKQDLLALANQCHPNLVQRGGGAVDLQPHFIETIRRQMLIIHLTVNVQDAMGANIVNTMLEALAPHIEQLIPFQCAVKIISNLSTSRMAKASALWKKELLGEAVIEKILDMDAWALADPYRCATHNKGIMNGIDAVALATGNDCRAIEAGAHAFAACQKNGGAKTGYAPLTRYSLTPEGDLKGDIELPLSIGIVGGSIQSNPTVQLALKIIGTTSASELGCVMAAVGLAQNFAALQALVTYGIQAGHMRLHSKNIALQAGVPENYVNAIAQKMCQEKRITVQRAQELAQIHLNQ